MELDSLLREHGWLTRLATALVGPGEADDLVQDTYRAALEADAPRARERGRLRGWLRVIATRRAAERWREKHGRKGREAQHARDGHRVQGAAAPSPGAELERVELRRFLAEAVLALDAPLRDVAVLRYFEDRSYAQIAAQLDITQALARQRTSRACAALRETLDRRSGGDRSVWVSALGPWVLRAPGWSARGVAVAGLLAAVAVLLSVAWWWSPLPAADALDPLARAPAAITEGAATLSPPLSTRGESGETARVAAANRTESKADQPSARVAFPLPPVRERATLDVLAIWDDTEEPAPGVWLLAFGRARRQTDQAGRVRFVDLPHGHGGVTSYRGASQSLKLEPGEARAITFRIKREFSFSGQVVDASGATVADAEILAGGATNHWSFPLGRSDEDGEFVLDGLSRAVKIAAAHPDHGVSSPVLVSARNGPVTVGRLVVTGGCGMLTGQVVDEDGAPMLGALVEFHPSGSSALDQAQAPMVAGDRTSSEGRFQLTLLPPGPGRWTVRTARHGSLSGEVEISRGEITDLRVELFAGRSIEGVVRDEATGTPVVQAMVAVESSEDEPGLGAWTDEMGRFLIERVHGPRCQLKVTVLDKVVHEQIVVPGSSEANGLEILVPSRTLSAHGFVVDEEGHPLPGCKVSAEGYRRRSWTVTTDGAGAFRIPHAPPSATALEVHAPEPHDSRLLARRLHVLPSAAPIEIIVPMGRLDTGAVHGRVVTADGTPVQQFDAEMQSLESGSWSMTQGQVSGLFRLDGVDVGRHALIVRAPGMVESLTMLEVGANETLELAPIVVRSGAMFRVEFAIDPSLGSESEAQEPVHVHEIRSARGFAPYRLYLGEAEQGVLEYGPVPSGPTRLVIEGAGIYREIDLVVPERGQGGDAPLLRVELTRTPLTPVTVEYPRASRQRAALTEGEILSFGLSWRLRDGKGRVVRRSYEPRWVTFGEPLKLHGLVAGERFLLEVDDVEGRSGSVELMGGSQARVLVE